MNLLNSVVVLKFVIITCLASVIFLTAWYNHNDVQKKIRFSNAKPIESPVEGCFPFENDSKGSKSVGCTFTHFLENIYASRPQRFRKTMELRSADEELKPEVKTISVHPTINESAGFNLTFNEKAREEGFYTLRPEENPYAILLKISLRIREGTCSGTLVTVQWVVTAAHCLDWDGEATITLVAGASKFKESGNDKVQTLATSETWMHPKYEKFNSYDVGVAKAEGKFKMTPTVRTMPISTKPWTHYGYVECKITGFGKVYFQEESSHDRERKTHYLYVKKPCLCNFKLKQILGELFGKRAICAKPETDYGICSGDSGGGLICGGKLRGTVSSVLKMHDVKYCEMEPLQDFSCGTVRGLGIFMDICPHLRWINSLAKVLDDKDISMACDDEGYAQTLRPDAAFVLVTAISLLIL